MEALDDRRQSWRGIRDAHWRRCGGRRSAGVVALECVWAPDGFSRDVLGDNGSGAHRDRREARRLKEETLEQVRREDREGQGGSMHGFRQGLREFHLEAEAIVRLERDVETLERLPDSNPAKRAGLRAARIRLAEAMRRWDQL